MKVSAEELKKFAGRPVPFLVNMGLTTVEVKKGYVKLMAPLKGNENHVGIMYAGALFSLAEVPGGTLFSVSFDVSKYYPIVKEMNIRFRRPATTDITVEMTMSQEEVDRIQKEADDKGKADFVLEGNLTDANGEIVAVSRGIYQIRAVA